ncbi:hypothetical protein DSO57_1023623 [Entomophthora muscae]|uniref:Uncharacterized protein n=1 Tax=Entomophthora muscae TaxID=34485 RepID=A0ACC2UMQ9_9FUNG|nr:hypothetical protein DSO57_1023623 [Entomophthora muscae]
MSIECLVRNFKDRFPFESATLVKTDISLSKLFKHLFSENVSRSVSHLNSAVERPNIFLPPDATFKAKYPLSEDHLTLCEPATTKFLFRHLLDFLGDKKHLNIERASCWVIVSSREYFSRNFDYPTFHSKHKTASRDFPEAIKFIYAPTIQALRAFFSTLHMDILASTCPKSIFLLDFFQYREQTSCIRELYDLLNLISIALNLLRNTSKRSINLAVFDVLPDLPNIPSNGNPQSSTLDLSPPSSIVAEVDLKSASVFYTRAFSDFSLLAYPLSKPGNSTSSLSIPRVDGLDDLSNAVLHAFSP